MRIYIAGHSGLVGSAVMRALSTRGYRDLITRSHRVRWDSAKPDGTPRKLLDTSRMAQMGWSPRTELPIGIRETYEWFLRNRA